MIINALWADTDEHYFPDKFNFEPFSDTSSLRGSG